MGLFHQFLIELSARDMIMMGYYFFTYLFSYFSTKTYIVEKSEKILSGYPFISGAMFFLYGALIIPGIFMNC